MKNSRLFRSRISPHLVYILLPLAVAVGYLAHDAFSRDGTKQSSQPESAEAMEQIRDKNYEFTRPLRLVNALREDSRLTPLKNSIIGYIDTGIQGGVLQTASVYLRVLNKGTWFSVNEQEKYSPGSLLKIPLMIYCLKQSEGNPSFLNRMVRFDRHYNASRRPSILSEQLVAGKSYTVEELIHHMIMDSDNDATIMLNKLLEGKDDGVYTDLDLAKPDPAATDYFVTTEEYSRFFRVLFNATYLSASTSDYALKMMSQSSFRDGIMKPLGSEIRVPRKFGERETKGLKQFHEFGIVYLGDEPYLLGVMTKGGDMSQLENVVSDVSEIVYNALKQNKPTL